MITCKILNLYLVVFLAYCLTCSDGEEVTRRFLRPKYRYNHPPAAEDSATIPVAVVYDKVIDRSFRQQKTINTTESDKNINKLDTKDNVQEIKSQGPTEAAKVTVTEKNEIPSVSPQSDDILVKPTEAVLEPEKQHLRLEAKIPVTVIYDDPSAVNRRQVVRSRVRKVNRKPLNRDVDSKEPESLVSSIINIADKKPVTTPVITTIKNERPESTTFKSVTTLKNTKRRRVVPKTTTQVVPTNVKNYRRSSIGSPEKSTKVSPESSPMVQKPVEITTEGRVTVPETTTVKIANVPKQTNQRKALPETGTSTRSSIDSVTNNKRRTREREPVIPIVESENHIYSHTGEFVYSYEGGDGTKAYSKGALKSYDEEKTGEAVEGGFSYTDKDGNDFSLTYTADENGYRPSGAHLPTPPPIPPAIARALKYLATKTTPAPVTKSLSSN